MVSRLLDSAAEAFAGLDISHGRNLDEDVSRARELLNSLTSGSSPIVPPDLLSTAKALAFSFHYEAGLGISGIKGHGFAIARLGGGSGQDWSAPLMFKMYGAGIGLNAGYHRVGTLIAAYSDRAVEVFIRKQARLGADLGLTSGRAYLASYFAGQGQLPDALEWSIADGSFVDLSLKGVEVELDTDYILRLYAREDLTVVPGRILRGEVEPPPEMNTLYSALRAIVSGTTSQSWGGANRQAPAAGIRYSSGEPWGTWQPAGQPPEFLPQHRIAGQRSGPAAYFDGSGYGGWSQAPSWGHNMGTDSHDSPLPTAGIRYPWPTDAPPSPPGMDNSSPPRGAASAPAATGTPGSPSSPGSSGATGSSWTGRPGNSPQSVLDARSSH